MEKLSLLPIIQRIVFLAVVFFFLLFSCKKNVDDDFPSPVPCDTCNVSEPKLKVVWQEPLWTDTAEYNSSPPVYWNGRILFSVEFDDREVLRMRDAATGTLLWEWDDHLGGGNSSGINSTFLHDNKLLYCSNNEVYAIDLENGKTFWGYKNPTGSGKPFMNVIGDYVYHTHEPKGTIDSVSFLVRAHVDLGVWDTIYTLKMKNGYRPSIYPPSFWIDPKGDTILIFQNRQWNFAANDGQVDIIAYNLTKDSTVFEIIDLDQGGGSNVRPPLVWEDKIYFAGVRTVYCIDAATGAILWEKLIGESLYACNWLIAQNKLIVNSDIENLYALDPYTGAEIWKETNSGATCWDDMIFYEGIVYFGCWGTGLLYAVDIETGEHIWAEKSPNWEKDSRAIINTGVAINPDLGYIYTADGFFALCIKLPER